jgi:hypothetical protein
MLEHRNQRRRKDNEAVGGVVRACSFGRLLQFVNKQLDLDGQLEVYSHLDRCGICRDAIYQLARDQDKAFLIYRAYRAEPYNVRRHIDEAAGSLGAGR